MTALNLLIWILIFFMGASVFSFLNVVIYRVPRHMDFVKGRSFCPACSHTLSGLDMIPVFGWVLLGGRCQYCKERISIRYMLVEALGGSLFCVCRYFYGVTPETLLVFAFFGMLTVIALVDADTMEIPDGFVLAVAVLGLAAIFIVPEITIIERLIGLVCISVPLLLLTFAVPNSFGGGDIKLLAAAGFFLGWKECLVAFLAAIFLGGGYGVYVLAARKLGKKDYFAFGPFLCTGMVIAVLFGDEIIQWYLQFLF